MKTLWKCFAAVALVFAMAAAPTARAAEAGKLLVWINGDKGYNGLQKIGDEFNNLLLGENLQGAVLSVETRPDFFLRSVVFLRRGGVSILHGPYDDIHLDALFPPHLLDGLNELQRAIRAAVVREQERARVPRRVDLGEHTFQPPEEVLDVLLLVEDRADHKEPRATISHAVT